jgi:DNA-binding beta-propeller fold protein YncE
MVMNKLLLILAPVVLFAQVEVDTVMRLPTRLGQAYFIPELNQLCVMPRGHEHNLYVLDCSTYSLKAQIPIGSAGGTTHFSWSSLRRKLYVVGNPNMDSTLVIDLATDSVIDTLGVNREFYNDVCLSDVDRRYKPTVDSLYEYECANDQIKRRLPIHSTFASWDSGGHKLYVGQGSQRKLYVYDYLNDSCLKVIDVSAVFANMPDALVFGTNHRAYVSPYQPSIEHAEVGISVAVIDGATSDTTSVPMNSSPGAVAVNQVTNKIYVACRNDSTFSVMVIGGATNDTTRVSMDRYADALAVNPVTNKVYAAHYDTTNVTVIDGATNATTTVAVGWSAIYMAVNSVTNKIYVVRSGYRNVVVIDGATNDTISVPAIKPGILAVNPVTNKVYVPNGSSEYELTVIDGATNDTTLVYTGRENAGAVTVNPVTNKIYMSWHGLTEITDAPTHDAKVGAEFDRSPGDTTSLARPNLTGKGVNRSAPGRTSMMGVANRMNTSQLAWDWATILSGAGTDSVTWRYNWGADTLVLGENFVCCVPLEDNAATTNNLGLGTPFAGSLEVYPIYRIGLAGGVEERSGTGVRTMKAGPTVVRGILFLSKMGTARSGAVPSFAPSLIDAAGRKVMGLKQGANDVSRLSPGVYFVREGGEGMEQGGAGIRKVVVTR